MTLAVRYTSARTLDTAPAEIRSPGPGEVELAPAFVGICGTDLHIFHGDMDARVRTPAVLGHEMSGRVVRVGPGVAGWAPGDAVTVMPLRWDDSCPACRTGHQHICQHLDFIGIDSPGAMQQRWTVPASTLIRLPDTLAPGPGRARRAHRGRRARRRPRRRRRGREGRRGRRRPRRHPHRAGRTRRRSRRPGRRTQRPPAAAGRGVGADGLGPGRRRCSDAGRRVDRGRGRGRRLRGVRRRGRRGHRGGRAGRARPAVPGGHPSPAPRDQPPPLLLARTHPRRRPVVHPHRLRTGGDPGRRRHHPRRTPHQQGRSRSRRHPPRSRLWRAAAT